MNYLRFIKLEFKLKAVKNFKSKGYAGNKLRGAIGTAMNKLFVMKTRYIARNVMSTVFTKEYLSH